MIETPFEIFVVSPASYTAVFALLARGLSFVALHPLLFASHTTFDMVSSDQLDCTQHMKTATITITTLLLLRLGDPKLIHRN